MHEIKNLATDRVLQEKMATDLRVIKRALLGDLGEDHPGLIERVRNLEEIETRRKWTLRVIVTSMMGATMAFLFSLFKD